MSVLSMVTSRSDTSVTVTRREPRSPPPNWDHVPFDVSCARCGHDIRGLTEPKCPACGLEFDWAEAVPIEHLTCQHCGYHLYGLRETRCPECGQGFTWEEILTTYYRKRIPLFEYQWRTHPVRSLVSTWFRALVPGKIWRTVTIHDPPRVGALWAMIAISVLTSAGSGPVMLIVNELIWMRHYHLSRGIAFGLSDVFWALREYPASVYSYELFIVAALWCAASFASLMIFRQSMKRYRVRAAHVFRVWAYTMVSFLPVVVTSLCWVLLLARNVDVVHRLSLLVLGTVLVCLCAFVVWLVREGYGRCLRMDHSLGVALASQVIACLSVVTILSVCQALGFWYGTPYRPWAL